MYPEAHGLTGNMPKVLQIKYLQAPPGGEMFFQSKDSPHPLGVGRSHKRLNKKSFTSIVL